MSSKVLKTCIIENCEDCEIESKTNCNFQYCHLLKFYLISTPSLIIGGTGISKYNTSAFFIWLMIICLFFLVIEIRVLCAHCPHYENSKMTLKCWANYGAPKIWKFRPWPMTPQEKTILISGFAFVWGYPFFFLFASEAWLMLFLYFCLTTFFFTMLRLKNCVKCINFSCPLNQISPDTKEIFLRNNPVFCDKKEQ